jgi:charged multivesicular body protein 6
MGNAFGKSKPKKGGRDKPQLTDQDRAILDLKLSRDGLKRYQQKTEKESMMLLDKAKDLYKVGNKKKAAYLMKVRKLKSSKIDELNTQLLTIETMISTIEWTTQSAQVFNAMQSANHALKAMQQILPIDRVESLMDDVTDSIEYQREIDDALSQEDVIIDDAQLNEELDRMAREMGLPAASDGSTAANVAQSLPEAPTEAPLILPDAPTSEVPVSQVREPSELERPAQALAAAT